MKPLKLFLLLLSLCAFSVQAQILQSIPMDSSIHYGKLANGLTYYIRHSEQPKERAEFFIVQKVGSILEEDSQNGLAHFLEHMAFNGTKHFSGNNIINYFETVGVKFGENINAYTSLDETVYHLSEVPVTREGVIDSALLVLHDWSNCILLDGGEIDKERGVIREEWRQGQTASRRIWSAANKVTMAGSQYAKRDVIGDTAIINNFSYETIRNYYRKWYRPDLQAILIVGDIDVSKIEKKIKALFADIAAPVNPAERIYYQVPDNEEPIVGVFTDPEMQSTRIRLDFKHNALPDSVRLSVQGFTQSIVNDLISSMANRRLEEIAQAPGTPFVDTGSGIEEFVRTKDEFAFICVPASGKESEARSRLLKEAETIKRFGFTTSELDRAKTDLLSSYEKTYKERNQRKNNELTLEYTRNFLSAEPIPGVEWEYQFVQRLLPEITIEAVNQLAAKYIGSKNIIFTIEGPQKEGLVYPANEELKQEIKVAETAELKAYKDSVSDRPLIPKMPKPGKVKKAVVNESLGSTEWTLSNGIKVIFKSTKFKDDEILMYSWSDGGMSLLPQEELPSAMYTPSVIGQSGLGTFSITELSKKLTGKIVSISPRIDSYNEMLDGSSSVKDIETLLQLTNLYFTSPRKDSNAYDYVMKATATYLENSALDPKNAYNDSIAKILYGYNPRVLTNNMETFKKVNYPSVLQIYKERFANPADFTFTFIGNIDEKAFKPLIELYLGSLKTSRKRETWKDNNIRTQKGQIYKEFEKPLKISKTTNYIRYSADLPFNIKNQVILTAIEDLLDLRYTATIREEEGASYGVGVKGFLNKRPVEAGGIAIQFDTDPKLYKKMLGIVHSEIDSLAKNGPRPEDLNKVKLNLMKQYKEDTAENGWWMQTLSSYYEDKINYVTDYEKAIQSLSSDNIQSLLKKILLQNNEIELLLTPEKK